MSATIDHSHVFLAPGHEGAERRTWAVIWLCLAMMVAEIVGGWLFGSIALIADGLHMSTHAGALLLAAMAYRYARRHAHDSRFTFGTGKFGDLAGFTSAIVLAMISLLIGYEAVGRLFAPVPIHFGEAIPIACLGLAVNVASVWLLSGHHDHHHGHGHDHDDHHHQDDHDHDHHDHDHVAHDHHPTEKAGRDNNMRAAIVHVIADAAVSVLVIAGLLLARTFGWSWIDPTVGLVGAAVIASWAWGLVRDTGAILLDMNPDQKMAARLREAVESDGDRIADFHLWRLGPGHLGAIVCVNTLHARDPAYYRARLARFPALSHVTIEVCTGN
jgi:cation diffusion facilitator family transporter